jgi:CheY-like chemotaxis protein
MNSNDNINILLADDDSDDRFFFSIALEEMLFNSNLKLVTDGISLIDYLESTNENTIPDIIFLDLNMPRKSGMEVLKEIRSSRRYDTICIAIYSTTDTDDQVDRALDAGANIFFRKPSEMEKIKEMIKQVIRIYRYYPDLGANEEAFFLSI